MSEARHPVYCSFCGKPQDEVAKLIAGPMVFICNECVELCQDIISGRQLDRPPTKLLPISLVEQKRDADAVKALADTSMAYRPDEDLPVELRELAAAQPVFFPGHVLLNRREWDRLIDLALFTMRSARVRVR